MELYMHSVAELVGLLSARTVSSSEVVASFLSRIEEKEGEIGAFLRVTADFAKAAAKESDKRYRENRPCSPFDGVPVALKDNICTKGIQTTCGSLMLENYVPPYDATCWQRLYEKGLVLLGKTNMDEFAMGSSTENSAYKLTRNPHDKTRVPGGSSGGSAAAVAASMVPWALGSDTGGSVREPASFCGLVGLKPTYGLVSRYGLVAFASSLDQVGTLTKNVTDAAFLLGLISGYDSKDATSTRSSKENYGDYLDCKLEGVSIGLPDEYFGEGLAKEVRDRVLGIAEQLEKRGATIKEVSLPSTEVALETYYLIADAEASSNLARYDGVRYGLRVEGKDKDEMFKKTRTMGFGKEVKRRIMLGTYVLSAGYYDAYYKKAQEVRALMRRDFARVFSEVEFLLTPTTTQTAFRFGEKKNPLEMYLSDIYTVTANLTGIPAVSLEAGRDSFNLPIGVQLLGNHNEEKRLLQLAYSIEQLQKGGHCHAGAV